MTNEFARHVLFQCRFARLVRGMISDRFQFDFQNFENWYDGSWLLEEQDWGFFDREVFLTVMTNTLWQLCINRNEIHFRNGQAGAETLFRRVVAATNDCFRVLHTPEETTQTSNLEEYNFNLKCDGAFNEDLSNAG